MELTPLKLPHGSLTMDCIYGTYTMEVTSWIIHHGSYLMTLRPWKLPQGTYSMQVTLLNLPHGSYLMELTPWILPHGTYTM